MLIVKNDTENIEALVERYEQSHGLRFPEQHRRFLLRYNGGETPKTGFRMGGTSSDVAGFYGLGKAARNYGGFDEMGQMALFLQEDLLPIAANAFGDWITIGLRGEKTGQICFRRHDARKKYTVLARTLAEFVRQCKSERIGEVPTVEERRRRLVARGHGDHITPGLVAAWQKEIDRYGRMDQEELILPETD